MSAVTVDVLTHTAHEAGLEGVTLQPLVNGACSFSSLVFKTTSYNLKGKPIPPTSAPPISLHPITSPHRSPQASRSI